MEENAYDAEAVARIAKRAMRDVSTGCLNMRLARTHTYGRIQYKGKTRLAHRLSYEAHKGPIPPGMFVCHRCDNPRCVAIEHLFLGSARDNARDCYRKGRTYNPQDKRISWKVNAKIDAKIAAEIKRRVALRETAGEIAEALRSYGVTKPIVLKIRQGSTWREVSPATEPLSDL